MEIEFEMTLLLAAQKKKLATGKLLVGQVKALVYDDISFGRPVHGLMSRVIRDVPRPSFPKGRPSHQDLLSLCIRRKRRDREWKKKRKKDEAKDGKGRWRGERLGRRRGRDLHAALLTFKYIPPSLSFWKKKNAPPLFFFLSVEFFHNSALAGTRTQNGLHINGLACWNYMHIVSWLT